MPSGEYLTNFTHELWIAKGTISSTVPTTTSGLTKVFNTTDASISSTSTSTSVQDWDSDPSSNKEAVTQLSKSMSLVLNLSPNDAAYQILRECADRATEGLAVRYLRQTAKVAGTVGTGEVVAGLATVTGFSEGMAVAGVGTMTFTLTAYGGSIWYPQGQAVATVTITSAGSGLTPASYTGVALQRVGIAGRNATATIVVAAGGTVVAVPTITAGGQNYRVGDVLTAALADIGGASPDVAPTFTVATVS